MQLPFSSKLLGSTLTSEEKQERRQQQLRRLQELNARRREEKLQLDQERLDRLLYVQVVMEDKFTVCLGVVGIVLRSLMTCECLQILFHIQHIEDLAVSLLRQQVCITTDGIVCYLQHPRGNVQCLSLHF